MAAAGWQRVLERQIVEMRERSTRCARGALKKSTGDILMKLRVVVHMNYFTTTPKFAQKI